MAILHTARFALHAVLFLFSFILMALAAAHIARTHHFGVSAEGAAVELLITSLFALFLLPILYVFDSVLNASWAFTVMNELIWSFILMIMFLAGAARLADKYPNLDGCNDYLCSGIRAMEAFGFLNFFILLALFATILTFAILAHTRGGNTRIWHEHVHELTDRNAGATKTSPAGIGHTPAAAPAAQPTTQMSSV